MTLITIHNAETNEVIEREMTIEEKAQWDKDQAEAKERRELKAKAKEEAEIKRTAALAKLTALGLTADDLKALGL
jgi:hypothetical protein